MSQIVRVHARQILDSRGNPTIEVDILTDNGIFNTTSQITKDHWTNDDGSIDDDKFSKFFSKTLEINSLKEDNTIFKNELITQTSI